MKQLPRSRLFLPLALVSFVGGAAALWSPIGCGCADAWHSIAVAARLGDEIERPDQINSQMLADGFAARYVGKRPDLQALPYLDEPGGNCMPVAVSVAGFRCTWWLEESPNAMRGFSALFSTNAHGIVNRVQVRRVQRAKQGAKVGPNNSSKPTPLRGAA